MARHAAQAARTLLVRRRRGRRGRRPRRRRRVRGRSRASTSPTTCSTRSARAATSRRPNGARPQTFAAAARERASSASSTSAASTPRARSSRSTSHRGPRSAECCSTPVCRPPCSAPASIIGSRFGVVRDAALPHRTAAGDGDAALGALADPADRHPRRPPLPRRGGHLPDDVSRTFDIGGPDVLTYRDMMQRFATVAGPQPPAHLPGPGPVPPPLEPVGQPGDAGAEQPRPSARRVAPQQRGHHRTRHRGLHPRPARRLDRLRPRRRARAHEDPDLRRPDDLVVGEHPGRAERAAAVRTPTGPADRSMSTSAPATSARRPRPSGGSSRASADNGAGTRSRWAGGSVAGSTVSPAGLACARSTQPRQPAPRRLPRLVAGRGCRGGQDAPAPSRDAPAGPRLARVERRRRRTRPRPASTSGRSSTRTASPATPTGGRCGRSTDSSSAACSATSPALPSASRADLAQPQFWALALLSQLR